MLRRRRSSEQRKLSNNLGAGIHLGEPIWLNLLPPSFSPRSFLIPLGLVYLSIRLKFLPLSLEHIL